MPPRTNSAIAAAAAVAVAVLFLATSGMFRGADATLTSVTTTLVRGQTFDGVWTYGTFASNTVPADWDSNQLCSESEAGFVQCNPWAIDVETTTLIHTGMAIKSSGPRTYRIRAFDVLAATPTKDYNMTLSTDGKVATFVDLKCASCIHKWTKKNPTQLPGL